MKSTSARKRSADTSGARLNTRLPVRAHLRIEEAAELSGATINQFVVQAALEKAERVIERERLTVLSARDARRLLELLDAPPALNAKLKRGLEQYRKATDGNPDRAFEWPPQS
jgi:uncharacterized protein (DUF1778 family)